MSRSKPYSRPAPPANPDGVWQNDLFSSANVSASHSRSRPASGTRAHSSSNVAQPSLLSRISDGPGSSSRGLELLGASTSTSKGHGASNGASGLYSESDKRRSAPGGASAGKATGTGTGVELLPDPRKKRAGALTDALGSRDGLLGRALGGMGPARTGRSTSGPAGGGASGRGRELLPPSGSGGSPAGRVRELFPSSSASASSGFAAPAPASASGPRGPSLGIHGRATAPREVWVRVENLAIGTTAEDVLSAFSSAPISSARLAPFASYSSGGIAVDLSFGPSSDSALRAAEEVVSSYNGAVADGNELRVFILEPSASAGAGASGSATEVQEPRGLKDRLGRTGAGGGMDVDTDMDTGAEQDGWPGASGAGGRRELLGCSGSGKMYSDGLAPGLPMAATRPGDDDPSRTHRATAWASSRPTDTAARGQGGSGLSLAQRRGRR